MKRLKKEISLLLVAALVFSSLAMGFGQLKASAVNAAAPGAGSFQLVISVPQNGEYDDFGTDESFKLQLCTATGNVVSQTPDNAISGTAGLLNNNTTTIYDSNGSMGGYYSAPVPSMGAMAVNKNITQARLVCTSGGNDWKFSNWVLNYWNGSAWVMIVNQQWSGAGKGATSVVPVSYFTGNYKTLTYNANGGTGGGIFDAIPGQTIWVPANPERTGYSFTGWSPSIPATMPDAAATYTAQWSGKTITFHPNGGSDVTAITQGDGSSADKPVDPVRTGYTFNGWYSDTELIDAVVWPYTLTDNVTFYAMWSINSYIAAFDSNGGSAVEAITQNYGTSVLKPGDPVKEGYSFGGWYLDPDFLTPVIWPVTLTKSAVFYAEWNAENCYTIVFNANGGSGSTSASMPAGDPLTAPAITKTGYTLSWSPPVPATVPAQKTIYTAQWTANTYSVIYDGNGNDAGSTASSSHTYGVTSTLTSNGFTKTGNTFLGWSTDQSATAATYTNGQSVLNLTPNQDEPINVFAVWSVNHYTIAFSANGGSGGTTASLLYGAALTAPTVTRANYTFSGWSPAVPATVPAAYTTYTAQWTGNQYTVTFDAQGGSVSPATITVTYAGTYGTLPTPTKTGYTFGGWYTSTGGAGTKILSTSTVSISADRTLYAKWTGVTYTVAYNGNGSTGGSTANSTHTYTTAKALTANGYTNTGCAFTGWATSADGDVVYSDGQSVSNLTEISGATITLYAKWINVNICTVTFDANGGTGGKSITLIAGSALTAPTVTKPGYTFAGWSPAVPVTVPAENITYTAQWTVNQYTVTFNEYHGQVSPTTSTVTYNRTYGEGTGGFPTPTLRGYTFGGWYTGTGGSGTKILSTSSVTITAPQTLYAKWNGILYTVSYNGNGSTGGSTASSTHTYGFTTALKANGFVKTGYFFEGWATSADGAVVYSDGQYVSDLSATNGATVTLYAKWTNLNVFTSTFDANGGTGGTSISLLAGTALTAPSVSRAGYTFAGWSPAVPSTMLAVNTTYTAQWNANTYFVTFNARGGSVFPATSTVTYGSTYGAGTGGFPMPTRAGYTFGGWYTSINGGGTNILSTTTVPITVGQYLFAKWTLITTAAVTITFNANGGTGGMSASMAIGTTLTGLTFTRPGYTFTGWSPALPAIVPSADTTYTAQWIPNSYTINYIGNGGIGTMASSSHIYDVDSNLTANGFTKTGCSFLGWTTITGVVGAIYADGQRSSLTPNPNDVITFYAVWSGSNKYTITFDANGGTGGGSLTDIAGAALSVSTVTRTGYYFAGWIPAVPSTVPASNTTYTAQWTAKAYTVTFNPQSGTVSPASSTVTYNSTYGEGTGGLPMPTRTGYTFGGWYTGTNGTGTNILITSTVAITAAQTLYANWTANSYTMTFDANGGTGGTSASMTYGATLTAPSVTRASYVFIGWSQAIPATVGAENANFTALWNLLGDVNGSDSITPIDALMTLQAASEKITLTDIQRLAADIDSSGTISPIDALKILQFTSGKISSF